jgi:Flp pilus assembly protein TadG
VSRRTRQRGNAFVETALVLVPLFGLILAIADFGLAIFLRSTFQHAVREGARYAVTYRTLAGKGHDASIKTIVQQNALGFLSGTSGASRIQIRYYQPDSLVETPANAPGNLVEVSVESFPWTWMAPVMRAVTPLNLTVRAADRMEGLPGGVVPPPR